VPSDVCGSKPWAGPADYAAHYVFIFRLSCKQGGDAVVSRFECNVMRRLLGFYPITQSSSVPIVWFDAMSRLLFAL